MMDITFGYPDKLPLAYYSQKNVCTIAKALIGKVLVTSFDNFIIAGRIVETEAYTGIIDKASLSWNGKRTNRTEVMYAEGGVSYIYLCYGIHYLFNVITNENDLPQAVLILRIGPLIEIEPMLFRTGKPEANFTLTRGPGNMSKAMGIGTQVTGISLQSNQLFIAKANFKVKPLQIKTTARIGVDFAGEDAKLLYRFKLQGNHYVSEKIH